ncbi:hypothetical protein ColLi_03070 [Colletotrichum liriopes]|uniref:Uncharacterized protein n=1 Tax=Colletotrichum liriopes TaxID=708192 RepID=A0AA37LQB0_9PEZI|nr:hypothetical protein ColLi_03070 [Colletotrichum liriopes]
MTAPITAQSPAALRHLTDPLAQNNNRVALKETFSVGYNLWAMCHIAVQADERPAGLVRHQSGCFHATKVSGEEERRDPQRLGCNAGGGLKFDQMQC